MPKQFIARVRAYDLLLPDGQRQCPAAANAYASHPRGADAAPKARDEARRRLHAALDDFLNARELERKQREGQPNGYLSYGEGEDDLVGATLKGMTNEAETASNLGQEAIGLLPHADDNEEEETAAGLAFPAILGGLDDEDDPDDKKSANPVVPIALGALAAGLDKGKRPMHGETADARPRRTLRTTDSVADRNEALNQRYAAQRGRQPVFESKRSEVSTSIGDYLFTKPTGGRALDSAEAPLTEFQRTELQCKLSGPYYSPGTRGLR